jgi:uncharacterized protein (DUF2336 family)
MAAIASAELIAELERTVRARPGRTAQMLRGVTDLLAATAGRLDPHQLGIFDDILIRLTDCVEMEALAQLSEALARVPFAQLKVIQRLAHHEEAAVAAPILQTSELPDEDLVQIAACRGATHGLAIARRKRVGEAIVDILMDRGDASVSIQLAKNIGAKFSREGYFMLARMAERNDELANLLVDRADVPAEVLRELFCKLPRLARARLLKIAAPQLRETIEEVIENIEAGICSRTPVPIDYSEAQSRILELNKLGRLNDSAVNRFATWREYRNLVVALSQLATVPIETIEPLLHDTDCYGLIVACRASRLNWNTALAVIGNRPDQSRLSETEIEKGRAAFESLNLSAAQRLIRFGSIRDLLPRLQPAGVIPIAEAG